MTASGDDRHQRRIDERQRELLLLRLARLEIVGEPAEDLRQLAGLGRDGDEAPIQIGEGPRPARKRASQRRASHHLGACRRVESGRARIVGLLGDGGEGLVERHPGAHERRELARRQRDLRRGQAGAVDPVAGPPPACRVADDRPPR